MLPLDAASSAYKNLCFCCESVRWRPDSGAAVAAAALAAGGRMGEEADLLKALFDGGEDVQVTGT